jgi:uncharacterized protein (DUF2236 family)
MGAGLVDESAVIRRVAGEAVLLAGGGRAILLQFANPSVARGVAEHSDFAARPVYRLRNTLYYVYGVLFGTAEEASRVARAVRAIHANVTGPGYRADDPALQVWVNATLFDTAMLLYQRVFGPLSGYDAEACYQQYSALATAIGCPETAWPASRVAFAEYWADMIAMLRVSDVARRTADELFRAKNYPIALRATLPFNRFASVGLLPDRIRAEFGYPWTERQERVLQRALMLTAAAYPHLPVAIRHAPKSYYVYSLRRRLARSDHPANSASGGIA